MPGFYGRLETLETLNMFVSVATSAALGPHGLNRAVAFFPGAHGVRCQVGQCGHSSNRVQAFFFFAHGCLGSVELCDQDPVVY